MQVCNDTYCVYAHINKLNGKIYVGVTKYGNNPNKRWKNGKGYLDKNRNGEYKQPHFAYAINKYGWDGFYHEIIASMLTLEEANNFEKLLVDKLKLQDNKFGYNGKDGGGSNGSLSDETKNKIRESHIGIPLSEEHKKALSKSHIGIKQSDEHIQKRVKKQIGQKRSEESRKRISDAIKKTMTPERRRQISESNRMRWSDDNARLRQSNIMIGRRGNPVFCIELNEYFVSAKQASKILGINHSDILMCCNGKRKSAGKHPITGEKLHWTKVNNDIDIINKNTCIS